MKKLSVLLSIAIVCAASCKKSSDSNGPAPGTWKVAGTTYTAAKAVAYSSFGSWSLTAATDTTASPAAGITFTFNSMPVASGNYKVVHTISGIGSEVAFSTFVSGDISPVYYTSTGTDNMVVALNVSDAGKITITMPDAIAKNNSNANDLLKVSASAITQP